MAGQFDGRRVVITGGSGFLGSAIVKALLDEGATCEVTWRSEKENESSTCDLRAKRGVG